MIAVEHLTKKYGDLTAVRDLSFKVEKGKIWGLLGPNAAGKTTTMRILTGYLPATDGKASVGGFDVFEQPNEVKKILGYLPEVLPLYPDMTVTEYLNFVAAMKKIPAAKVKEAVAKAIKITGLETVKGRLIKNISRGYKQRVGHRPGPGPRSPGHHPRRADDRPRPGPDHRDPEPDQVAPGRATRSSSRPTSWPRSPRPATASSSSTRAGSWPPARSRS